MGSSGHRGDSPGEISGNLPSLGGGGGGAVVWDPPNSLTCLWGSWFWGL